MSQASTPSNPSNPHLQPKTPQVKYDFGAMLKARPQLCRILQLLTARMRSLELSLQAHVMLRYLEHRLFMTLLLDCINVVDYSLRPANPAILEGGPLIEYDENHELLHSVSQCVPNTDGEESWDPSVKFAVLTVDQSYIIAQRFEVSIVHGLVIGLPPEQEQRRSEGIKAITAWLEQFQVPADQGRALGRIRSTRGSSSTMP
jgi:hypothetical protein